MSTLPPSDPDTWTCPVCRARHSGPSERCRRCGSALMLLIAARRRWQALADHRPTDDDRASPDPCEGAGTR